jgi:branched-chain amino acid transport system substrate-binding protein
MLTVALLAAPLAAAGCSSSSSSSNSATSAIPIGVVGTYSGPVALSTVSGRGAIQAWADSVNAAGGIDGHPVRLYVEDDAGDAATGLTEVKDLVQDDHVVAIVGQNSANIAWDSYIQSTGVPVVGGGETIALPYLYNPDFFNVGGNIISTYYGVVDLAAKEGSRTGILYCAEASSCAGASGIETALGKPKGVSVVYAAKVSGSLPDYTAPCLALKNADVQSYDLGLASAVTGRVAAQCQQLGLHAALIQPGVQANTTLPGQSAFNGTRFVDTVVGFFNDSTPATKEFHDALAKYAPGVGTTSDPMDAYTMATWASGMLFEAAVKASGDSTVTAASVKKGLYALKGETLGGLVAPLTFTPVKANLTNCYFNYTLDAGKFVESDNMKPTCADGAINSLIGGIAASMAKQ